ncbi:MAG: COX15/CtaA family protein [Actinobacteria bacterium]|nr:COX15/CtaA family protein [Actinomycetota bacterium]
MSGPQRFLAPLRTDRGFWALVVANAAVLWVIIVSGSMVRLTASGLGCPDWPLCDGGVVPAEGVHQFIEYGNRVASGLIILVTVATWIASRGYPSDRPAIRGLARATALQSLAQMPLGGLTVLSGLHPMMVGAHFLLSIGALTTGVLLVVTVSDQRRGVERGFDARRGPFAVLSAVALLVVVVTGVLVTAAGPHSGDDDVLKRFGDLETAAWIHVRAVGVMLVLMGVLAFWLRREPIDRPLVPRVAMIFAGLLAVQITLGELQYRNGLPWQVVAAHVSVAGLVWATGVATTWMIARPTRGLPHVDAASVRREAVSGRR